MKLRSRKNKEEEEVEEKKNKMSLMEEHDDVSPPLYSAKVVMGGGGTGGADQNNQYLPYQFVQPHPTVSMVKQDPDSAHSHPPSKKGVLILMGIVAIALPILLYIISSHQLGAALSYPFALVVVPSLIIFVPFLAVIYRLRGALPFVRRKGITALMSVSFAYYSVLMPLYLACLMAAFFTRETDLITYIHNEYYSASAWLVALPIIYMHGCVFFQYAMLSQCTLRSKMYNRLISWPASIFFTTIILSIPFLTFLPFLPSILCSLLALIPLALSITGIFQTLRTLPPNKWTVKDILIRSSEEEDDTLINKKKVMRVPCASPNEREIVDFKQPISIIQIADPHLGPMMSVERLEEICESTVKLNPDCVLLTGDFFTTECFNPPDSIYKALKPLKKLAGKTFACLGNHDYEDGCKELLEKVLKSIGCCLLVDQSVVFESRVGKVQIIGFDYRNKNRQEHVQKVCEAFPPIPGIPRIGMLHDPGAFKFVPLEYGMFVLSGHTHGGQIGLNCLGINSANLVALTGMPDHGLWQNGRNYLYVHSGQGSRSLLGNMVLRVGVPAEDSMLMVHFENSD